MDQNAGIICIEWYNWNCLRWPNCNKFNCTFSQFIRCNYFWQAVSEIISSVEAEDWVYESSFSQHSGFSYTAVQTEDDLLPDFLSPNKSDSNHKQFTKTILHSGSEEDWDLRNVFFRSSLFIPPFWLLTIHQRKCFYIMLGTEGVRQGLQRQL